MSLEMLGALAADGETVLDNVAPHVWKDPTTGGNQPVAAVVDVSGNVTWRKLIAGRPADAVPAREISPADPDHERHKQMVLLEIADLAVALLAVGAGIFIGLRFR